MWNRRIIMGYRFIVNGKITPFKKLTEDITIERLNNLLNAIVAFYGENVYLEIKH